MWKSTGKRITNFRLLKQTVVKILHSTISTCNQRASNSAEFRKTCLCLSPMTFNFICVISVFVYKFFRVVHFQVVKILFTKNVIGFQQTPTIVRVLHVPIMRPPPRLLCLWFSFCLCIGICLPCNDLRSGFLGQQTLTN